jgi:pteridine reductase
MSAMRDSVLSGQAVLVTGAAKRIGAAIARGFHAEGACIAIHYHRSASAAQALCDELNRARPNSATTLSADLRDTAALPAIIEGTVQAFGKLNVLINNASTFYSTPIGTITLDQWQDLIGTNLRAPLFLSQAAAPHLRQSNGSIVNIIDIHGQRPLPQHPVYSTAKAGLLMLTRSLARELGPNIRVNGIAPGPILWPEGGIDPKLQEEIVSKTLLKRSGSPEDVVKTALFFAKDAPYVTGQILAVDGGRSVGW